MKESKIARTRWLMFWSMFVCLGALSFGSSLPAGRQVQEDEVRDLTRTSWKSKRAAVTGPASAQRAETKYKITKRMPRDIASSAQTEDSEIGLTVWRLRPAKTDDAVEIRDLVQRSVGPGKDEWTPERVSPATEFYEEQLVRVSIESLRGGFLYVIDRAKYKDGTYGDPYLVFPTLRIYGGNNKVEAGRAIQIPGPEEEPFKLERGRMKLGELQESEELIILVTPQALQSFAVVPQDRQKLTEQSVETLIRKYDTPSEVSEKIGGVGRAITVAEKRAGSTPDRRLGAEDPYPQTIYRLAVKRAAPMLVRMQLRVVGKN